jgi:hypothetical protein
MSTDQNVFLTLLEHPEVEGKLLLSEAEAEIRSLYEMAHGRVAADWGLVHSWLVSHFGGSKNDANATPVASVPPSGNSGVDSGTVAASQSASASADAPSSGNASEPAPADAAH